MIHRMVLTLKWSRQDTLMRRYRGFHVTCDITRALPLVERMGFYGLELYGKTKNRWIHSNKIKMVMDGDSDDHDGNQTRHLNHAKESTQVLTQR